MTHYADFESRDVAASGQGGDNGRFNHKGQKAQGQAQAKTGYETKPLPPLEAKSIEMETGNPPWYFLVLFLRWLNDVLAAVLGWMALGEEESGGNC